MSFFWIKLFFFFKKRKTRTTHNYKKCGHPFVQQCLLKLNISRFKAKLKGKARQKQNFKANGKDLMLGKHGNL